MTTLCKKLFGGWKKKSYIEFYSLQPGVCDIFPISKSSTLKRNFANVEESPTEPSSKNCPGIKLVSSAGYIVPAPADFTIVTNNDGVSIEWHEVYRFSKGDKGMEAYISIHSPYQSEPLIDDTSNTVRTVIKVETPWRFTASEDIVLLQLPVSYNNEDRFQAATGILDPNYAHYINVQLFWKKLNENVTIKAGTPLAQLIPISRKLLNLSNIDVTIRDADNRDLEKEKAFSYANNCVIMQSDKLSSRLSRTISILNKFKK